MEIYFLLTIIFTFLICIYFYVYFQPKPKQTTKAGFKVYPLVGSLPELFQNRHRPLEWLTEVLATSPFNTSVFVRPGNIKGVITANPQNVEYVVKKNFDNYPKGPRVTEYLDDLLGKGFINSDGEWWKIQRKIASHEFSTKSLRNFAMDNVKVEIQTRLIPIIEDAAGTSRVLDMQEIFENFAFDNICKVVFNVDPCSLGGVGTFGDQFMNAVDDATRLSSGRFFYVMPIFIKIKKFFNIGSERQLRESIVKVHKFANKIINSRREDGGAMNQEDGDLLSRFIHNNTEHSAEFLRDIVITFIIAGRDTTSSGISWFFWLLSSRPNVEENILQELESIRQRNGKTIGDTYDFDELHQMHYLHAALSESMRLYPPVPINKKTCLEDDVLPDGTFVKKNWSVYYVAYSMGRMESIWGKDCCEYKPERWLENGIFKPVDPCRFSVFHAGPRLCIGKDMAYIQMKSIAASILERFKVDVLMENDKCPEHLLAGTLRMKGGLPVRVKERKTSSN